MARRNKGAITSSNRQERIRKNNDNADADDDKHDEEDNTDAGANDDTYNDHD